MSERKNFDLGDYVEVKDRIKLFYELFGQGRLVTGEVRLTTEPDGKPRVMVQGLAYRTPDDPLPGVGWSWLELPGNTPYTKGSEIENAETSAWGRAIGSLGILIDRSIASAQEVQNKSQPTPAQQGQAIREAAGTADSVYVEEEELMGDFHATGMVRNGTAQGYKLEARQGPDGHVIGFRMEFRDEKSIPQVIVEGPAGEALYIATAMNPGSLVDTRLTVDGRLYNVKAKGRSWKRLRVSKWQNAEFSFPPKDDTGPEPPADAKLFGEKADAAA